MSTEKTKTKGRNLKAWVWAALIVAALVWGYFAIFHQADVVKVKDGKAVSAKPTWLIGYFAGNGGEARYYKLADVSSPKGYTEVRGGDDPDGDPVTTWFSFAGKDPEKNPGTILVEPVGLPAAEAAAQHDGAQREADEAGKETGWIVRQQDNGETRLILYMPSPYPEACIRITVCLPADQEEAALTALMNAEREKVIPGKQLSPLAADFKLNFLDDNRWTYLTNGLLVTLQITLGAVLLGIVLGILVAIVRSTWDQNRENLRPGFTRGALSFVNELCSVYLTVIRGTPVVIQLMIMYYIIFSSSRNGVAIAMLAFGINSGAYVAEIIRGGIMSVDRGQLEAGRSLGFNYVQTMRHIIIPQAMKNVLPALANEFIVLLKETSVAGYVAVKDLTKGGDIIRGVTYSAFMPLIAVALIYLVLVMFFTRLVRRLERRLRASDH